MASRTGFRSQLMHALSVALMAYGVTLLVASLGFLAYSKYAEIQLAELNRQSAETFALQPSPSAPEVSTAPAVHLPTLPVPFMSATAFPPATRVQIPRLEIDSGTSELSTTYENGELVWETPKHSVGHHKGTANPGEIGNMVLSGHISSPLRKEGNVFQRLPEIRPGDEVIITSDLATIVYKVTETKVVEPHQVEVMNPTTEPVATLITCVPDWVYTHRLIVTAKPYKWEYNPQAQTG